MRTADGWAQTGELNFIELWRLVCDSHDSFTAEHEPTISPDEIQALPMAVRRFALRVLGETTWKPTEIRIMDYEHASYCYVTIEDEPMETFSLHEDGSPRMRGPDRWSVTFRKLRDEGWRFREASNGDEETLRTIVDLLYHIGSKVEHEKVAR